MQKILGWILTTLMIPVVVFAYQRFVEDVRARQTIAAELSAVEFELAMRLGQASSSFNAIVDWGRPGPGVFRDGITSEWLQGILLAFRHKPIVDIVAPTSGARILVAPAAATMKDTTLLGLFARGIYLQQQMLDFVSLTFFERVLAGQQVSQDFCSIHEKEYLERAARRMTWPPETPPAERTVTIEQWRPSTPGVNDTEAACLKAAKYREAIAALLIPDAFVSIGSAEKGTLLRRFSDWFSRRLLSTVPDYDLPYVDTFAG